MSDMNENNIKYADYLTEFVNQHVINESDKNIFLNRIDNSKYDGDLQLVVASDIDQYMTINNLGNE